MGGWLFAWNTTRFGLLAAQIKPFFDLCDGKWFAGKLQDKAVGVFGDAGNVRCGQESTLLALQNVLYHRGSVIGPIGYTDPCVYGADANPS